MAETGFKTYNAKKEEIDRKWYLIDASGKTLGKLATEAAKILRGKNKAIYTPNVDCGDFVVVINAEKIKVSGKKMQDKKYYKHSGYIGNLKTETLEEKLKKKPEDVVRIAVKGMLPHNKLNRKVIKKLKIYKGSSHPHKAQKPEKLEI
ncbi:MAG: 50S ribosomal protein L13 [Candidatus Humimicrobiaceae bacterium]